MARDRCQGKAGGQRLVLSDRAQVVNRVTAPSARMQPRTAPSREIPMSTAHIVLARFRRLFWLKALGITAFMWSFFLLYFQIQRFPQFAVTDMSLTWLDRNLPMQAWGWVPYLSLWVYTSLPPALQPDFRSLVYYGFC